MSADDPPKPPPPPDDPPSRVVLRPFFGREVPPPNPGPRPGTLPPDAETEVPCPACKGRGMLAASLAGPLRARLRPSDAPSVGSDLDEDELP